jgi:hypothetical protein
MVFTCPPRKTALIMVNLNAQMRQSQAARTVFFRPFFKSTINGKESWTLFKSTRYLRFENLLQALGPFNSLK